MSNFLMAALHTEPRPLEHQSAAWAWAWAQLSTAQQEEFLRRFRADPATDHAVAAKPGTAGPLAVPYFSQRDSGTDQAARMCFSSSCAMLLEFLRPGTLKGPNGDDQYLRVVQRFGDTTDAGAQVQALQHFGVKARMVFNADFELVCRQLERGIPVPAGYIHRGPVDDPRGGGHYLIIIGIEADHVIVHDPWGEADLIIGSTVSSNGKNCRYSKKNFGRRWMVSEQGGRYRSAPGQGWAIIAER